MLEKLKEALSEALEDEYKARATYQLVLQKFGDIRPFVNILQSEERHIKALFSLFQKYQIPIPVDTWKDRVETPNSVWLACEAGVEAEIENGEMKSAIAGDDGRVSGCAAGFFEFTTCLPRKPFTGFSTLCSTIQETPQFLQGKEEGDVTGVEAEEGIATVKILFLSTVLISCHQTTDLIQ